MVGPDEVVDRHRGFDLEHDREVVDVLDREDGVRLGLARVQLEANSVGGQDGDLLAPVFGCHMIN